MILTVIFVESIMDKEKKTLSNKSSLKMYGYIMIAYGILYALLGTIAAAGLVQGFLPGQESGVMLLMVLAYVIAILAIICGFACLKGNNGMASVLGLIFAIMGLISLVYAQISQDAFNLFDCITMVLGVAIFYLARKN